MPSLFRRLVPPTAFLAPSSLSAPSLQTLLLRTLPTLFPRTLQTLLISTLQTLLMRTLFTRSLQALFSHSTVITRIYCVLSNLPASEQLPFALFVRSYLTPSKLSRGVTLTCLLEPCMGRQLGKLGIQPKFQVK